MRRRPPVLTSVVAAAAVSLLTAGCGGGGGAPGVANVHSTATTTAQNGAVAYAHCMRSNGVTTFPDPNSSGRFAGAQLKSVRVRVSVLRAATSTCSHLLPSGLSGLVTSPQDTTQRTQVADELSFATCMRSHGVTRFPDPTPQGHLSVQMVEAQGIDVHSAAVLRIVQMCLPASHGALTPARVREALHNAGD
jgi:hypothetical protein